MSIFACIFIFGCLSTVSSNQAKLLDSIDPEVLSMIQERTQFVVDDVLAFLDNFATTIESELYDLDESLNNELQSLGGLVKEYSQKQNHTATDCEVIDRQIEFREQEKGQVDGHVLWMRRRIEKNYELIRFLYEDRCHSHMIYINFLANSKEFLRLLSFLREAIESYNMVQMQYFTGVLEVFIQDLSISDDHAIQTMFNQLKTLKMKHDKNEKQRIKKELKEQKEATQQYGTFLIQTGETEASKSELNQEDQEDWDYSETHSIDEVGLDKVDEFHDMLRERHGKPQFQTDFYDVKDQLLAIIDNLKAEIVKTMEQRLVDELESNIAASEYLDFLQKEIQWLHYQIEEWLKPKGRSVEILKELKINSQQCHDSLDQIMDYIRLLKAKINLYGNNREAYREKLQREVDMIQHILDIYRKALGQISDDFKERIDDGLEDRSYPKTKHHHNRKLKEAYGERADTLTQEIENKAKQISGHSG